MLRLTLPIAWTDGSHHKFSGPLPLGLLKNITKVISCSVRSYPAIAGCDLTGSKLILRRDASGHTPPEADQDLTQHKQRQSREGGNPE
jgi:hypothetical protein